MIPILHLLNPAEPALKNANTTQQIENLFQKIEKVKNLNGKEIERVEDRNGKTNRIFTNSKQPFALG